MVKSIEESILGKAEKQMLRMILCVRLANGVITKNLMVRLGLDSIIVEEVRQGGLRCLGHVGRKEDHDCVKQAWRFEVEGSRERVRPRLAWKSMIENLCHRLGLGLEDAHDSVKWRERVSCRKISVTSWKRERC